MVLIEPSAATVSICKLCQSRRCVAEHEMVDLALRPQNRQSQPFNNKVSPPPPRSRYRDQGVEKGAFSTSMGRKEKTVI